MQLVAKREKEFTGKHMLAVLIAFFGVVIGVNVLMAYLANATWSGLIVSNGYVASQSFNGNEARAKAQQAQGWAVDLRATRERIAITFNDASAVPLTRFAVEGKLHRTVNDREDRTLTFTEETPGVYVASGPFGDGLWEIDVTASQGGNAAYERSYRFIVN